MTEVLNNQVNTFKSNELFKILILGSSEQYATTTASWISNNHAEFRGVYKSTVNEKEVAIYFTWPEDRLDLYQDTIGIDALIIAVDKNKNYDIEALIKETENFKRIEVRLLISEDESNKVIAEKLNASYFSRNTPYEILNKIDELDREEFIRLRRIFDKYDTDNSGKIEIKEFEGIAKDLGQDIDMKIFTESMLSIDKDEGNYLNFEEFLQWWKVGRNFIVASSKISQINTYSKLLINKFIDFKKFLEITKDPQNSTNLNLTKIDINLDSGFLDQINSRFHLRTVIGGPQRYDAAKNFLSKFTDIHSYTESSWINISCFAKSISVTGEELLKHMLIFQEKLINWLERNYFPDLRDFLKNFIEFRSFSNDSSANVYMKIKLDIEDLLKSSLGEFILIRDWISDDKNSMDMNLRIYSSECLGTMLKNNKTVADFLNSGELSFKATTLKARVRSLLMNIKPEYQSIFGIFQFFFMSSNLNLKFKGPFDEFLKEGTFKIFNDTLEFMKPFFNFIKENFDASIREHFSRMEFTANIFEIFANLMIFSESVWHME